MIRSFIAVALAPSVLRSLQDVQQRLRQAGGDVRWSRPEGLHVTLKFLGSVLPDRLEQVHSTIAAALQEQPRLTVRAHGLGAFPNLRRPRVLWAGLNGEGLVSMARRIDAALVPLGFEAEQRPFNPHVTLGRVNSRKGWPALEVEMRTREATHFGDSTISAVNIYRSEPQRGGSVYTLLWTVSLR